MNNEFLRQYKRVSKKHSGELSKMIPDLKELFSSLLKDFPSDMVFDLIEKFIKDDSSENDIQRAADIIDLYNEELDGENSDLSLEDWFYLKELVNSYAEDLDIEWVAYVMQLLLDKNIL
jgi:5'-deoxynucleotidase YfbR-like HD superfamily hydrolase